MGTSSSSKGSGKDQPMVPPWADDQPDAPLPEKPDKRFQAFRRSFGRFLKNGDAKDLRRALGHYARTSTGGSAIGPRRFGSVYGAGGDFYEALSSLGGDGTSAASIGLSKSALRGQPLDVVCQRISQAMAPANADADRVRRAIDEAMLEVLGGAPFDPDALDSEVINRILCEYLAQTIFQEIVDEVGGSWASAPDEARTPEAEGELLELIRVVVDDQFSRRLAQSNNLNRVAVKQLMREAVTAVWQTWEGYDD